MRAFLTAALAAVALLAGPGQTWARKIAPPERRTFRQYAAVSKAVVYGHLAVARQPGARGIDLVIREVLKPHPALRNRRTIRMHGSIAITDPKNPPRLLLFIETLPSGHLDP